MHVASEGDERAGQPRGAGSRLQALNEARHQISALIYTYAERLDSGDLKGVAALFGRGRYGAQGGLRVEGAAAVERLLNSRIKLYDGVPRTPHVTTNLDRKSVG